MSFVSIVSTENFISVACDGRVSCDGEIIQEDFKKFITPTQNSIITFAGHKEPTLEFISSSGLLEAGVDLSDREFSKEISQKLMESSLKKYKIFLGFGGKSSVNGVRVFTLSSTEMSLKEYAPTGNDINYAFLHNGSEIAFDLEVVFTQSLGPLDKITFEKLVEAQVRLNNRVSETDFSVNKNVIRHLIA